jgi:CheY-like chemotaxis protein
MTTRDGESILLVEDSPEDYEATRRAFRKAGFRHQMLHCATGDDALDFLHRRGRYAGPPAAPRPAVILLDLNLPGTDGRDVLAEIKSARTLASIPVVVLTTSADARDVEACYRAGANSYVQKPVDLESFMRIVRRLHDYWFDAVILPRES